MDLGESPQMRVDTIAALQKEYAGRRRFKAASAAVEGWKHSLPTHMAAPMPQEVCLALVNLLFTSGKREVAIIILLCFAGVLRVGEALQLRVSDVLTPSQHQWGYAIVLLLRATKRGAPDAGKVVIRNAGVVTFVLRYLAIRRGKPFDFFAPASYNTVARWIARGSL